LFSKEWDRAVTWDFVTRNFNDAVVDCDAVAFYSGGEVATGIENYDYHLVRDV